MVGVEQAAQAAGVAVQVPFASGRVDAPQPGADPLEHAAPYLSPSLLAYLRSAEAERPQVLNRKTLHAHLKEIDSL